MSDGLDLGQRDGRHTPRQRRVKSERRIPAAPDTSTRELPPKTEPFFWQHGGGRTIGARRLA
eukprot:395187-Rhodomonas_salina.1